MKETVFKFIKDNNNDYKVKIFCNDCQKHIWNNDIQSF